MSRQNPNPAAAFASQTIPLDLSGYRFVVYCSAQASTLAPSTKLRVNGGNAQLIAMTNSANTAYGCVGSYRNAYATSTGVTIEGCVNTYTGGAVINNQYNVPIEIWGII